MDNKLTVEEKLSIFHLYHKSQAFIVSMNIQGKIQAVMNLLINIRTGETPHESTLWPVEDTVLLLRRYYSMNEQEANDISKIMLSGMDCKIENVYKNSVGEWFVRTDGTFYRWTFRCNALLMQSAIDDEWRSCDIHLLSIYHCYQYLINHSFAIPLFFGVGHWATGMNAYDLGIAKYINS